jgi:hypothetical protein
MERHSIAETTTPRGGLKDRFFQTALETFPVIRNVISTNDFLAPPYEQDTLLEWIESHPEVVANYVGEWVAFDGHRIVGHSSNFAEASIQAMNAGAEGAVLYPVIEPNSSI